MRNSTLKDCGSYFKISAFLISKSSHPLESDIDICDSVVDRTVWRKDTPNKLAEKVKKESWLRSKILFKSVTADDILGFPMLTDKELRILFT